MMNEELATVANMLAAYRCAPSDLHELDEKEGCEISDELITHFDLDIDEGNMNEEGIDRIARAATPLICERLVKQIADRISDELGDDKAKFLAVFNKDR
jgi:hypothetical protein